MIKIDFSEPTVESWKRWRTRCVRHTSNLLRRIRQGQTPNFTDIYKNHTIQTIFKSAGPPFYGKCSYCESDVSVSQFGDIDHWRPKAGVTDEMDRLIVIRRGNGPWKPHPGYYWLAYEWRNLIYCCEICNRPSRQSIDNTRIGKWNRFPVHSYRAIDPGEEANEFPLLINPLEDDPSDHMYVDFNGVMIAKTDRGQMSIDIFGLNTREGLIDRRSDLMKTVDIGVKLLILSGTHGLALPSSTKEDIIHQISAIKIGSAPYSAAGRTVVDRYGSRLTKLMRK